MSSTQLQSVVLAAGGTAGHVFPALAIYRQLKASGTEVLLLSDERGLRYADGFDAADVEVLPSGGLVTGSVKKRVGNLSKLGSGYLKARKLLKARKPDLVVGLGGYPSVGPLLAAQHLGLANVLHEQNSVMGAANKVTARKADAVALSFDPTEGARGACHITGNPSRESVVAIGADPFPAAGDGPVGILVMGGSQGARSISETVPQALASLPDAHRSRLRVVHQAREEDHPTATGTYAEAGIDAEVVSFVDVPAALPATHLVISRSGATTVCDMAVARRPAIYLPLLTHADLQQVKNAAAVVDAGGALIHREDEAKPGDLGAMVAELLDDPSQLATMADAARTWSRPDAATAIVELVGPAARRG
jgi:UDP-N-acetylglucosamine--N-acetylmuramyl-(pentapeptide) pyrophosphoryl-undecaprenol N-acetylglucosamine transferase